MAVSVKPVQTPTVQHQKHTVGIGLDEKIFIPFSRCLLSFCSYSQTRRHFQPNLLKGTVQCFWPNTCFLTKSVNTLQHILLVDVVMALYAHLMWSISVSVVVISLETDWSLTKMCLGIDEEMPAPTL